MNEQIEITLSEETSQMLFEDYELKQDKYDSFDEYMQELNTWLNLKMKEANLKGELRELDKQIRELEMKA